MPVLSANVLPDLVSVKVPMSVRESAVSGTGDSGYITGIVTENNVGVARRVMCYHRRSGILVSIVLSGIDGKYRFDNLIAGVQYFITSLDENGDAVQYNAVTQDLITASEVVK